MISKTFIRNILITFSFSVIVFTFHDHAYGRNIESNDSKEQFLYFGTYRDFTLWDKFDINIVFLTTPKRLSKIDIAFAYSASAFCKTHPWIDKSLQTMAFAIGRNTNSDIVVSESLQENRSSFCSAEPLANAVVLSKELVRGVPATKVINWWAEVPATPPFTSKSKERYQLNPSKTVSDLKVSSAGEKIIELMSIAFPISNLRQTSQSGEVDKLWRGWIDVGHDDQPLAFSLGIGENFKAIGKRIDDLWQIALSLDSVSGNNLIASEPSRRYLFKTPTSDTRFLGSNFDLFAHIGRIDDILGSQVRDADISVRKRDGSLVYLSAKGEINEKVGVDLFLDSEREPKSIRLTADDSSGAFALFGLPGAATGGTASFELVLNEGSGGVKGEFEASSFSLLSGCLTWPMLDGGDLRGRPRNIAVNEMDVKFTFDGTQLRIGNAELKGPSLNANGTGILKLAERSLTINGEYEPIGVSAPENTARIDTSKRQQFRQECSLQR